MSSQPQQMATAFGGGDLKARVNPSLEKHKDEMGDLGRTFNDMAERIESIVARYKIFLAHASHEHARIGQEADRLNTLVQELLLLARLESGNELSRKPIVLDIVAVAQEAPENQSSK
jgi:signal transduction histidine kinase